MNVPIDDNIAVPLLSLEPGASLLPRLEQVRAEAGANRARAATDRARAVADRANAARARARLEK